MWSWRRKVDLTIGPLQTADRFPSGAICWLNNYEAQRHVLLPLDLQDFEALHAQALYVNASRAILEKGPPTLTEVKRKIPFGFGILTRLDQSGFGGAWSSGREDCGWINRIVVEAEWRRRGLGRALCKDLCEQARKLGFAHVACLVRPHGNEALAFFNAMGFVKVHEFFVRREYGGTHTYLAMDLGTAGATGSPDPRARV